MSFGSFALLLALFWASDASAHALSCTNPHKYTYYTEDPKVASKCRSNFDGDCNWISTSLNCTWQGSYKSTPQSETKPQDKPKPSATSTQTKTATHTATSTRTASESRTATQTYTDTNVSYGRLTATATQTETEAETETETPPPAKNNVGLEEAVREANISTEKVQEMKITMEELKVSNQNNAILYRSPEANMGSMDPRFNVMNAGISSEAGRSGSTGGLLGNGLKSAQDTKGLRATKGRGLASTDAREADIAKISSASAAGPQSKGSSATSDNPWVTYMGQTSKAGLIDRLRKNPNLRDSLRDRIAELQANGDKSGVVELMEEALASAEKESQGPNLDDLKPMAFTEAFSMDASETEAQIRSLIADLDNASDPQLLPQISLFERVSVAHRRSLVRGSVRSNR